MKKANSEALPPELAAELAALSKLDEASIDTSDAPEVRDWSHAKRGKLFRPVKIPLSLRLDADVVEWFRGEDGRGYQTRINAVLREYMEKDPTAPSPPRSPRPT
jgi:uncharacterized protein (DUF4415 family)